MNLSLPFFDVPAPAPRRALPQAGAGGRVGIKADADAVDAGGTGGAVDAGDADHADTPDAIDTAGAAAIDPLAGLGFESSLDAVERAARASLLHPGLWRASQIGTAPQRTTATGFEALDAQLPGGGWPHGVLTELLLAQPGVGELRLLAPALAAVARLGQGPRQGQKTTPLPADEGRCVMLFDPPAALCAWALVQCGLNSRHWLVVQSRAGQGRPAVPRNASQLSPLLPGADLLWALEQALKSGHVGAILAWLPLMLRADALRRLQIAAQAHDGPVFVFRDAQARSRPSPAPLRVLLQPAGVDGLQLRLLKRRGPPLDQPLRLVLPAVLSPYQQAQAQVQELTRELSSQAARA